MTRKERDRLNILCADIATEQNDDRFLQLVYELNALLEQKELRLEDIPSRSN